MKRESYLLWLNACIFLALLLIPRDMNGRIHPFSLDVSRAVMLAVACGGVVVSVVTLAYYRKRWVIPTLCLVLSLMYIFIVLNY